MEGLTRQEVKIIIASLDIGMQVIKAKDKVDQEKGLPAKDLSPIQVAEDLKKKMEFMLAQVGNISVDPTRPN